MPPKDPTLQPEERKLEHPEAPFVRVLDLGPHKRPVIQIEKSTPKRNYGKVGYATWTGFAFLIGLSLTSFMYNTGGKAVAYFVASPPPIVKTNNEVQPPVNLNV